MKDITKLRTEFLKKYGDQLLPHAEWALKMFVRYAVMSSDGNHQALERIEEEMKAR